MNHLLETRSVPFEVSAADGNKITGKAVVYNSLSKVLKTDRGTPFKEMLLPGCFARSLKERPDVMALKEHNPMYLLGRTSSGTLKIEDRSDGLYVDLDLGNQSYAQDLKESIKRGDISGFSFAFTPVKQRTYFRSDMRIRELTDVDLIEVSLVGSPAYTETEVCLRSEGLVWEGEPVEPTVNEAYYQAIHRHYKNLSRQETNLLK